MNAKSRYASFSTHDVRRACENKLDIKFRESGVGCFDYKGKTELRIKVHAHKKDGIAPETFKSMAKQLDLTEEEFAAFLKCTFGLKDFLAKHRLE